MLLSNFDAWCWFTGVIGFILLAAVLVYKKRYQTFPWFTGLLFFEIIQTVVLFLTHRFGGPKPYFYVFFTGEIIEALIRVGVMFELARITAKVLGEKERLRVRPLLWSLLVAASICVVIIFRLHGIQDPIVDYSVKVSLCTTILAGFLALCFAIVTMFDGIRVRIYSQAVTYGLVLYFAGKLIFQGALLLGDPDSWAWLQNGLKPVYIICLFAWAGIFWFEEPKQVLTDEMEKWRRYSEVLEQHKPVD